MKKSFLILPFIALGLTACNTGSSESNSAEITNANTPAWQTPEVEQAPMPSNMTQINQTMPQMPAQPGPSYGNGNSISHNIGNSESIGGCQVVRDGANNPIYAQIQKGCYTDSSYTVGKYDTVFLIAYLSGTSVADLARLNHLSPPYQLKMGQVLRLK